MFRAVSGFRRLQDLELSRLGDDDLVAYIRRARAAGELEAMRVAIQVFCFGLYADVLARVRARMEGASDADVEAVAASVIEGAMLAEFRGESVGELRALVTTVLKRRVADHYRRPRGGVRDAPLPDEHADDEEIWGQVPRAPEELSGVWANELFERSLDGLSPAHRAVVERRIAGYSARETTELVNDRFGRDLDTPMTPSNVDQIYSRFRHRHRDLIEEAERGAGDSESESDA